MPYLNRFYDDARAMNARVVFPELHEPRVAKAAARLQAEGVCSPVDLPDMASGAHVAALVKARGVKESIARRMLKKPLYLAAAMVAAGEADAMVAGADAPSRRVIEAVSIVIGLAEGVQTPSSSFLMRFPDGREMVWADCGLNVAPDAQALSDIARASERTAKALFGQARVALLSFSTGNSGTGGSVERVRAASEATGFVGPVQGDAALNPRIAGAKGLGHGDANVLVFPDLDSGNIAYKLAQELAGAQALGPILQGFRRPVCDLSRGATVEDIVSATLVTLALARAE